MKHFPSGNDKCRYSSSIFIRQFFHVVSMLHNGKHLEIHFANYWFVTTGIYKAKKGNNWLTQFNYDLGSLPPIFTENLFADLCSYLFILLIFQPLLEGLVNNCFLQGLFQQTTSRVQPKLHQSILMPYSPRPPLNVRNEVCQKRIIS
jgi:hypothetical protein